MTLSSLASRRARRILVVPAALALTAGVLAGCSDSGSTTTETSASESASETSSASGDSAAQGEKVAGDEVVGKMLAAITDAGSYKTEQIQPGLSEPAVSEVVIKDGKTSSKTTANAGGAPMEIISLNNAEEMYIKSEQMGAPTWTKVEAISENPQIAMMAGMMEALKPMMDPTASLKVFESAEFTNAGTEDVNGTQATKYTGEVSMAEVMSALTGGAETAPPSGMDGTVPVEIYLNDKDQPVKMVQTVNGQATETTYSDFGGNFTIEAPAVGS